MFHWWKIDLKLFRYIIYKKTDIKSKIFAIDVRYFQKKLVNSGVPFPNSKRGKIWLDEFLEITKRPVKQGLFLNLWRNWWSNLLHFSLIKHIQNWSKPKTRVIKNKNKNNIKTHLKLPIQFHSETTDIALSSGFDRSYDQQSLRSKIKQWK